ncbi:MAG: HAD family hydrolase [Ruminococcus sp.]|jgi:phosphoglycolate phosphatase
MYKCILFDLDGTLVNSFEGICHAYEMAFQKIKKPFPGKDFVRKAIGAPLPFAFRHLAGVAEEEIVQAVACYREYYHAEGIREAFVYEGVQKVLAELKARGCFLGTATLKKEEFARKMLQQLGLLSYFSAVCGTDEKDSATKAELILRAMKLAQADRRNTILVGDTPYDERGAGEAGVDFLAVTYGFGFCGSKPQEISRAVYVAQKASEILPFLIRAGE